MAAQLNESLGQRWTDAMDRGDFPAAWAVNDQVLAQRDPAERDDPALPYHQRWIWDGRPVDGRGVLVRCYHGLGDTIQFSRFLPALRRRAAHLTLEVQPELIDLLGPCADRIVPFDPQAPIEAADCTLEIMELAHALRTRPKPTPYLVPPPLAGGGRGEGGATRGERATTQAGLCWHVNSNFRPNRSIPSDRLAPLLAVPGITWHSLQHGTGNPLGLGQAPASLNDTARLIAQLDLVVTVDTMVAHLAGAIGTPIRLLLDADPDWRWRPSLSPWYQNVRKYRQPEPGNWTTPIADLARELPPPPRVCATI